MIKQHQFAFMKHSSTTIALIKAIDSWKMAIDNTEKVVCAFHDLRKAFDSIDHNILLQKLSKHLHGKEYEWFRSYLSERSQYVSCNGIQSEQQQITYGVPQGSVLGPTLFNIHINDISSACENSQVILYADDTEFHASSNDVGAAERSVNDDLVFFSFLLTSLALLTLLTILTLPTIRTLLTILILHTTNYTLQILQILCLHY